LFKKVVLLSETYSPPWCPKLVTILDGIQDLAQKKQLRKVLHIVLLFTSAYVQVCILSPISTRSSSGKGQPWYEFSSMYTIHNALLILDNC